MTYGEKIEYSGPLYDSMTAKDGKIILDFNLMQNPPCGFTTFATCPLPPKENKLPFAIEAGEKTFVSP